MMSSSEGWNCGVCTQFNESELTICKTCGSNQPNQQSIQRSQIHSDNNIVKDAFADLSLEGSKVATQNQDFDLNQMKIEQSIYV